MTFYLILLICLIRVKMSLFLERNCSLLELLLLPRIRGSGMEEVRLGERDKQSRTEIPRKLSLTLVFHMNCGLTHLNETQLKLMHLNKYNNKLTHLALTQTHYAN